MRQYELAQGRVLKEHDIQAMLEMNRITRLLHKSYFKSRQRLAMAFSHKFVIMPGDVEMISEGTQDAASLTDAQKLEVILDGF